MWETKTVLLFFVALLQRLRMERGGCRFEPIKRSIVSNTNLVVTAKAATTIAPLMATFRCVFFGATKNSKIAVLGFCRLQIYLA